MKKVFIILIVILSISLASIVILRKKLPDFASFFLSSALKAKVQVSEVKIKREGRFLSFSFDGVRTEGWIEGFFKRFEISFEPSLRLKIAMIKVEDFDVRIKEQKKAPYSLLFLEKVELQKGFVRYRDYQCFIDRLRVKGSKEGRFFTFEGKGKSDGFFQDLSIFGEGTYEKDFSGKGIMELKGLELNRISKNIEGKVFFDGTFSFTKNTFTLQGKVKGEPFALNFSFLRRPILFSSISCPLKLTYRNHLLDLSFSPLYLFKDSPFSILLNYKDGSFLSLRIFSDFLPFDEVKKRVNIDSLSKKGISNYLFGGKIKIESLEVSKKAWHANIYVKGLNFLHRNFTFERAEGEIFLDDQKIKAAELKGFIKNSLFQLAGYFLFEKELLNIEGKYDLDLRDLPSLLSLKDLKFVEGFTKGNLKIKGDKEKGYEIFAKGEIERGEILWKKVNFKARGLYEIKKDEILFDPLILSKGKGEITVRGRWRKDFMKFFIKGREEAEEIRSFLPIPLYMKGPIDIKMAEIEKKGRSFNFKGDLDLKDVEIEVKNIVRKKSGIKTDLEAEGSFDGKDLSFEKLRLNLDGSTLFLKGKTSAFKTFDFYISSNLKNQDGLFFRYGPKKGRLDLSLTFKGLKIPLKTLPYIEGRVILRDGTIDLPFLPFPLSNVNLYGTFSGDIFKLRLEGLRCGKSLIEGGVFSLQGLNPPNFSLSLNSPLFNLDDFFKKKAGPVRLPKIEKGSILEKSKGSLSFNLKEGHFFGFGGENIKVEGEKRGGQIFFSPVNFGFCGGKALMDMIFDLSSKSFELKLKGRLSEVNLKRFFDTMGFPFDIQGKGILDFDLFFSGEDTEKLIKSVEGRFTLLSKEGTIKKWELLSKVFALLNIYDLFRGKVDLSKEGLYYKRLSATFFLEKGTLKTKDFFIDSPSMLIKAEGKLDLKEGSIDGKFIISPFVAIDKTLEKIPIVRQLLREKKKGFIYASCDIVGKVSNPEVRLNVLETVTGGFIDSLKRIITLPEKIE